MIYFTTSVYKVGEQKFPLVDIWAESKTAIYTIRVRVKDDVAFYLPKVGWSTNEKDFPKNKLSVQLLDFLYENLDSIVDYLDRKIHFWELKAIVDNFNKETNAHILSTAI